MKNSNVTTIAQGPYFERLAKQEIPLNMKADLWVKAAEEYKKIDDVASVARAYFSAANATLLLARQFREPNNSRFYLKAGQLFLQAKSYPAAELAFTEGASTTSDPQSKSFFYIETGLSATRQHDYLKAAKSFHLAGITSNNERHLNHAALYFIMSGNSNMSIDVYHELYFLTNNPQYLRYVGNCFNTFRQDPELADYYYTLADLCTISRQNLSTIFPHGVTLFSATPSQTIMVDTPRVTPTTNSPRSLSN